MSEHTTFPNHECPICGEKCSGKVTPCPECAQCVEYWGTKDKFLEARPRTLKGVSQARW